MAPTEEEQKFRQAIEDDSESIGHRHGLAIFMRDQGRLSEAIAVLDRCIEMDPSNDLNHRMRANFLARMGLSKKAVIAAMNAVALAPESVQAHLIAIRIQLMDLKPAVAQQLIDNALQLEPEHTQLQTMKNMQQRVLAMTHQADHTPLKWFSRKLKERIRKVAVEADHEEQ